MSRQILSISQVNDHIRKILDADSVLGSLAVRGEISNYKVYPSGHHYFTLKDENASLKCVMFKSSAVRLRFHPENGMKIIAMGNISVYPRDGAYQLYCTSMIVDGVGDLHVAFEQLKSKLAAKGLFSQSHKQRLPEYPQKVVVVTSSAGAAIHDILRVIRKRYPLVKVCLLPVRVQGAEAPAEIASAIRYANIFKLGDVMIVGRGGGSIEDLWAFNDETVAHAIFDSVIPVISAVGHEPDVTISDFVADVRAATPSNAAEIAVPDKEAIFQQLDSASSAMENALRRQLKAHRMHLDVLRSSSALQGPYSYIEQKRKNLQLLGNRLVAAQNNRLFHIRQKFLTNTAKLDAMSPLKVLSRGYAMITTCNGKVVRSINQVTAGDTLEVRLNDGTLQTKVLDTKENV